MKKYYIISGLILQDNNRGTAALGYGSFSFLKEKGYLQENMELVEFKIVKKIWKYHDYTEGLSLQGMNIKKNVIHVNFIEMKIFMLYGILLSFTKFGKTIKNIDFVACINGGDGFSDIYNTNTFIARLRETFIAMRCNIPVIQLPQTLGPFKDNCNYLLAKKILQYSTKVYVRDDMFVSELKKMGISYEITNDLSAYMKPEPWDISIDRSNSIGINVSGLAYSNSFRTLSGQFDCYPDLINSLIEFFQEKGKIIYLIPHSYHYGEPEPDNDDLWACREVFSKLIDKRNVILIEKDLKSPQIKYLISQMSFFIGTRMHANYAAIFTKVPLYGLAYSYKFQGAFERNGIFNRISMINNIGKEDIPYILENIEKAYLEDTK